MGGFGGPLNSWGLPDSIAVALEFLRRRIRTVAHIAGVRCPGFVISHGIKHSCPASGSIFVRALDPVILA
eukprot:9472042-Pyramimonas_sp.AAC.1